MGFQKNPRDSKKKVSDSTGFHEKKCQTPRGILSAFGHMYDSAPSAKVYKILLSKDLKKQKNVSFHPSPSTSHVPK